MKSNNDYSGISIEMLLYVYSLYRPRHINEQPYFYAAVCGMCVVMNLVVVSTSLSLFNRKYEFCSLLSKSDFARTTHFQILLNLCITLHVFLSACLSELGFATKVLFLLTFTISYYIFQKTRLKLFHANIFLLLLLFFW